MDYVCKGVSFMVGTGIGTAEANRLLKNFCEAIGVEVTRSAYGEGWPRAPLSCEFFYSFRQNMDIVGWGAIRMDTTEPYAHRILGVYPEWQNKGYAKEIGTFLSQSAMRIFPRARGVMLEVSRDNKIHLRRMMKRALAGDGGLQVAGRIDFPKPGYALFWIDRQSIL